MRRLLTRHGLDADEGMAADPFAEATPFLAGWATASVRGLAASGVSAHQPHRLGARPAPDGPTSLSRACHARWEAFDLHAGVCVPAGHRDRLERICLVPLPRMNLILYHGVTVPRAVWRTEIVPHAPVSSTDASAGRMRGGVGAISRESIVRQDIERSVSRLMTELESVRDTM